MDTNNLQLDETSRSKLDKIVMQMTQNKEPDENIHSVVQDFKVKYGKSPVETPESNQPQGEPGLWDKIKGRASDLGKSFTDITVKKGNPVLGALQGVGAIAGGINDTAQAGMELIPGVKQVENAVGGVVGKAVNTAPGQAVVQGAQNFAQAHPDIASAAGAVGNIAGAAGTLAGFGSAWNAGEGLLAKFGEKKILEKIAEDISPKISGKSGEGTIKSLINGTIKPVLEKDSLDTASLINREIPSFRKLNTFSDKKNVVKNTVRDMSDSLKNDVISNGQNRIYSFKELGSKLHSIEPPIMVKSDATLKNAYDLVTTRALQIAKKNGGKISNLFDARKEFDSFIERQFPDLYSSEKLTPMRSAIKDIRNGMNEFISDNLPENVEFRSRLLNQSKLLSAIDEMSPKEFKEIGTTRWSRFAGRHPVGTGILKGTAKVGASVGGLGALGAGALSAYKNLTD